MGKLFHKIYNTICCKAILRSIDRILSMFNYIIVYMHHQYLSLIVPLVYDPQIVCHTDHNSVLLPVVLFFFDSYCHAYLRAIFFRINICTSPADGGDHTGLIYRGNICV